MNRVRLHSCMMFLMAAVMAVCGCSGAHRAEDRQADAQAIRDLETQWNLDYVNRDLNKLTGYYAEDAVLIAPGMSPSTGNQSIREELAGMVSDPALSLKFSAARIEVAESGDLAYTQGSYLLTMTDPQSKRIVHDNGSYVTTYRRQTDGRWKAVADIASSATKPGTAVETASIF